MEVDAPETAATTPSSDTHDFNGDIPSYSTNDDAPSYSTSETNDTNSMDVTPAEPNRDLEDGNHHQQNEDALQSEDQANAEELKLQRLREAMKALQQPDAILEDDVFANIRAIFEARGSPQEIIKSLSSSYRGYPQMCNLVSHWLRVIGTPDTEIVSLTEEHVREAIQQKFDPHKADKIFEGAPPLWLNEMIGHSHWRHLIYQLSESHRDCLLLNYGIQQISEAGHDDEIASLPSAATYFTVFNRVLSDTIKKALRQPEYELSSSLQDFSRMCYHSEHTFIYTQAILSALADSEPQGRFKRLAQELNGSSFRESKSEASLEGDDEAQQKERSQFYWSTVLAMTNVNYYPELASALHSVMRSQTPSPVDVRNVHHAYSQPSESLGTPPVDFLRNPLLLDKLIGALFNAQQEVPTEFLGSYFWVLAVASGSRDTRKIVAISPPLPSSSSDSIASTTEDSLEIIMNALKEVRAVCRKVSVGMVIMPEAMERIMANIHIPIVSMCILHWIRACLCDPEKVASSWSQRFLASQLAMVREIAATHPLQLRLCLQLLQEVFTVEYTIDPITASNAKKKVMECAAYLMECGHVLPVLHMVEFIAPGQDQSITRHFLITVLDMVAPPFSQAFLEPMVRLLSNARIESSDHRASVLSFVNHVLKPGEYQLSQSSRESLTKVQRNCSAR